jgi:DNA-binding transcriptional ArsR family regulator
MANIAHCFTALGDPTRRRIFERLRRRPLAVGDLSQGLPISRPAVSQHLKVLKSAGLVKSHYEGTRNVYQIDASGIAQMREYLDQFWEQALVAFKKSIEKEKHE